MLELLEIAEARCDRVMNDAASTYEQRLAAIVRLARRAYSDSADADRLIQCWIASEATGQTAPTGTTPNALLALPKREASNGR